MGGGRGATTSDRVLMRDKRRGRVEMEEEMRPQARGTCSRQQLEEVGRTLPGSPRRSDAL